MSDSIKAGDNVVVTYASKCGCVTSVGVAFTVAAVVKSTGYQCASCGYGWDDETPAAMGYKDHGYPLWRLKKLPPLTEDEQIDTAQDLGVPA